MSATGTGTAPRSRAEMEHRLSGFVARETGAGAEVRDLQRVPGGFSYETWTLRARWMENGARHDEKLVLRRAPRGGVLEPYDAMREMRLLKALEPTGIPTPRALWGDAGDVLGTSFYLMEFVDGRIPLPWDSSIEADTRREMHRQFTEVLADLHALDPVALGLTELGIPPDRSDPAALELDRCEATLDRVALRPYPVLREVIAWLREHRPRSPRLSLVHDDYRMGNIVWRDGRIAAVLDWERAFVGDPMADVAFTRIESLAGWCSIQGAMAVLYAQRSGIAVDETRVGYHVILELLKATLVALTGMKAFAEGRTSDLRLVQIGRGAHQGILGLAEAIGLGVEAAR